VREEKLCTGWEQMDARRFLRYSCNCVYLSKIRKTHQRQSPAQQTGQEGWWLLWDLTRYEPHTAQRLKGSFQLRLGEKLSLYKNSPQQH